MAYTFEAEHGCLIDMDGLIADFARGVSKAHGRDYPYDDEQHLGNWDMFTIWNVGHREFFAPCDEEFWANLDKFPEADEIVSLCEQKFGFENIAILSHPSYNPGCMPGKLRWLERHYPRLADGGFIFGKRKKFCANPFTLLVDDYDKNVDDFRARHGNAFLFPRPWNRAHHERHDPLASFRKFIADYSTSA